MPGAAEVQLAPETFYRRLPEYLARLRLEGLAIGVEQESRLFILLSRLESAGTLPKMASTLARYVVPVLAGTPAQQAICHSHFRAMFSELDEAPDQIERSAAAEDKPVEWKISLRHITRGVTWAAVAVVIFATIAIVVFAVRSFDRRVDEKPPIVTSRTESKSNKRLDDWIQQYPLKELDLPKQAPWNRTFRWYYTEFGWQKFAAAALPWLVYALGFSALVYLTLAHLRREALRQNLRTLPFSFRSDRPRFGDRALLADLQPLRILARHEIRDIDSEATVFATAKQGGLLTLRWLMRPIPADFVVLIDRRSRLDHLAAYGDAIVETLRSSGLFVEQFDFDRSPWTCRRRRSGETETLRSVLGSFPGAIFLFFVTESELLDPSSGEPRTWIDEIGGTTNIFLMVPAAGLGASPLELAFPDGISVADASPTGLRAIANRLLGRTVPTTVCATVPGLSQLVTRINERADRWMQSAQPAARDLNALVAGLRQAAGADTYRWLAATSVYPELRWAMTLHLRDRLTNRRGLPATLAPDILNVAQLPWFRRGWMPDWVRTRLLKELSGSEHRRVRSLLIEAMDIGTATRPAASVDVSVRNAAGGPPTERLRSDNILVDYLLPGLTSKSQFFAVPEEWARKIARRPWRRLLTAAVCGAVLAAVGSFGALSLVPIDKCDLWGTSPLQTDNVGPPFSSFLLDRSGYIDKVVAACKAAMDREPDKVRFRYQFARAHATIPNDQVNEILFELAKIDYIPAINTLGYMYKDGVFPHDLRKAAELFLKAYSLGSVEAGKNLAVTYEAPEFDTPYYRGERSRLLKEYAEKGGSKLASYAMSFRDGTFGFSSDQKKFLEIIRLGAERKDGESAVWLGYLYGTGEICEGCTRDPKTASWYYLKAIEWDAVPSAARLLARNYYSGNGVERNINQALYWAMFAARLAEQDAIELIYEIFSASPTEFTKLGVEPTLIMAQLKESAEGGDENSQYSLGMILEYERKMDDAIIWYRKASNQGHKKATEALQRLSSK
ncbi:tetratricopeptide repeat protein [Bradyrhizobium sp. 195]|uniref:tetratricopeptide repeat protein n=1 Tax=Bradyrhizobium sp. 195 TaxID=2782662 RepID=UPI00200124DF|nr:tetratricopeptide repeat protein [Bradyrhizobium sp. 195]UPK26758.1 sel1 repeat family protein [Bradyrhizobium sp. 195]